MARKLSTKPTDFAYTMRRMIIIGMLFGWVGLVYDHWVKNRPPKL